MNNFQNDLDYSHSQADEPWWGEVYKHFFPNSLATADLRDDGWWQRAGVDRQIVLKGKTIYVDEKVRRDDWPDFGLEYISNDKTGAKGWVCKELLADYIAYAFAPSQVCYLLPVNELQNAWRRNGQKWLDKFGSKQAINDGYKTHFCPVPRGVLGKALTSAMVMKWGTQNG